MTADTPAVRTRTGRRRGPFVAFAVPILLLLLAGGLRAYHLGHPDRIQFDETFYAEDARDYVRQGVEGERPAHPPVGKWAIAAGIAALGFEPVGWRLASAVAGTATVLVVYLVGLRIFDGSIRFAGLAAALVAVDGIALTMSRIAMLDVFQALFVATAFLFLVAARQASGPRRAQLHHAGAGVALGLAVGTKWSSGLALAAALLVALGSEWTRRRQASGLDTGEPAGRTLATSIARLVVPLLVVPGAVYVASYAGWFTAYPEPAERFACEETGCEPTTAGAVRTWAGEHHRTVTFHQRLIVSHPYRSAAIGWPLLLRPVLIHLERCPDPTAEPGERCAVDEGNKAKTLVVGNPGLWWPALLAYPALAWWAIRRKDWRARGIGLFLLLQWAPWLASPKQGYLFYLTPLVPFVALAACYAIWRVDRPGLRKGLGIALAATAFGAAAYLLPLWLGVELPADASDDRLLLDSWR